MKYASVCSGVEAASLAWMPLGWEAAWFSEIEPFPCAVLKKRFPHVPNLGDMTKIEVENLENGDQRFRNANGADVIVPGGVDLLVGGTPCQGFSIAGKQEGLNDDRSVLCLTYTRLLEAMRPKWFVWENVPGCLSSRNKQTGIYDFNFLLAAFAEVGYTCGWRILDAQYVRVDGYPRAVPQRRRRVFVVGYLGGEWQYPASVLFESDCLQRNTPPRRVKGQGFTADVKGSVGKAGRLWDNTGVNPTLTQCGAVSGTPGSSNQELFAQNFNGLVMDTFSSSCHGGYAAAAAAAGTLKSSGGDIGGGSENLAISIGNGQVDSLINTPELARTLDCMHDQQAVLCLNDQVVCVHGAETPICNNEHANPVTCNHNGLENVIACNSKKKLDIGFDVNATLKASDYKEPQVVCYANHATVRRLLPVECERLMGFPDNWTRIPWKGKSAEECPDGPRYKACGNSMCVNVMRWIGMRIEIVERRINR